jgi:hypothetical protein
MKPMGLISTPFITYRDIKIKDIDLIEDAMAINTEFHDVIALLRSIKVVPGRSLTTSLIKKYQEKSLRFSENTGIFPVFFLEISI